MLLQVEDAVTVVVSKGFGFKQTRLFLQRLKTLAPVSERLRLRLKKATRLLLRRIWESREQAWLWKNARVPWVVEQRRRYRSSQGLGVRVVGSKASFSPGGIIWSRSDQSSLILSAFPGFPNQKNTKFFIPSVAQEVATLLTNQWTAEFLAPPSGVWSQKKGGNQKVGRCRSVIWGPVFSD